MAVGKGKHNQQVEILPLTANSAVVLDKLLAFLTTGYKHICSNVYLFIH